VKKKGGTGAQGGIGGTRVGPREPPGWPVLFLFLFLLLLPLPLLLFLSLSFSFSPCPLAYPHQPPTDFSFDSYSIPSQSLGLPVLPSYQQEEQNKCAPSAIHAHYTHYTHYTHSPNATL
jgi:hypothetical protein